MPSMIPTTEFLQKTITNNPNWVEDTDNEGQIIIYTNKQYDDSGYIVDFNPED